MTFLTLAGFSHRGRPYIAGTIYIVTAEAGATIRRLYADRIMQMNGAEMPAQLPDAPPMDRVMKREQVVRK